MHKKIELVVLQASAFCNINCKYCYLPNRKTTDVMTDDMLDVSFKKILGSNLLAEKVMLLWHSGEPLAVGIPFYEKALKLIKYYNINEIEITNAIQTNATLITDEWCQFFKNFSFKVGVSLDGPAFLHNENRVGWNRQGTFKKVMDGVELLRKYHIPLAAICVITKKTLDYPRELLNFFLENGFSRLSLSLEEIIGENTTSSLSNVDEAFDSNEKIKKYSQFIQILFQLWLPVKNKIYIREFVEMCENISGNLKDPHFKPAPEELMELNIVTIQKNGNISTYCPELASGMPDNPNQFVIGNILQLNELDEISSNDNFKKIKKEILKGVKNCETSCDYFKLCGGRSPSIKMYENGSFESTETQHCILHRKTMANVVINELKEISKNKL